MPVKNESSNFHSSPVHDMMNDLPIEIELEGVESKRSKLETIVDLRDTRLGALLVSDI